MKKLNPEIRFKKKTLLLRGRIFTLRDLHIVTKCTKKYFDYGRTRISLEICKILGWNQPNGWPKDRACRDVLLKLEKAECLILPPRLPNAENAGRAGRQRKFVYKAIAGNGDLRLEFAKGNKAESQWNKIISEHHYLGHKVVVGRCIKYLVKYHDELVGAICFSSASWRVESRNAMLQQLGITSDEIRECVINNSRFLVIPGLNAPYLASRILSLATRQVAHDWEQFYSVRPKVVETFVQPSRFSGTCYKAANWIPVGMTKGYAKKGNRHLNSQEPKYVFLYGLDKSMRRKILAIHNVHSQKQG